MENTPAYLKGRGRGRGRGKKSQSNYGNTVPGQRTSGAHQNKQPPGTDGHRNEILGANKNVQELADQKFEESRQKFQEAARKHLGSGDLDLSDEEEDDISDKVLSELFKSYSKDSGGENSVDVDKAQGDLLHSFRSGTSACLICIETIKKEEPIWNCVGCYGMFHIQCVQRWVKEGVYQQVYQSEEQVNEKELPWHCPKCRYEYQQYECPTRYLCFCGRTEEPEFDPWLVPHSCGQNCGRKLKPECGHQCRLLCHPGACPSCPQTVKVSCYCGKSIPQTRRCSARTWACGQKCGQTLSCGQHKCDQACHPGDCLPCPKYSSQKCECGKEVDNRPCASPKWQCTKVCGRRLLCGNHTCEQVCHAGICGQCPRAGQRSCPCGKSTFELPCTEDIPTCVDTCGKLLDCGSHSCMQRCHTGPCGACRQMITKTCRCGQRQKEVPCYKDFLCEVKCANLKDCKRHQCKRKCCDGSCPPCEQQCNKTLRCHNHKCASRCHRGPCYPCTNTIDITCNCKSASVTVPCGREKNTKPPRCKKLCLTPTDCHHEIRAKHRCHFGDCPPCRWVCQKSLSGCSHTCPEICHTAVRTKIQEKVIRAGPWEPAPKIRVETVEQPCPPCQVPVPLSCLGKHEVSDFPCADARPWPCHRVCRRELACGNHVCNLACHEVLNAPDNTHSGINCEKCENQCAAPRPQGCKHACLSPCHPGACPPCKQMIRMRCHCKATVQHVECHKWNKGSEEQRIELQKCGGECPRLITCGHPCGAVCHPGQCADPKQCEKKVNIRCPCKRRKKEFQCKTNQAGHASVLCDDICEKESIRKKKNQEEAENELRDAERKKQQAEFEDFERKVKGKKKKKQNNWQEAVVELTFWDKHRLTILIAVFLAVVLVVAGFLLQ